MTPEQLAGAVAAEQRLLDPSVRRDPDTASRLLADDFTEIGASGRSWSRLEILDALASEPDGAAIVATDWAVRELAEGVALVTFVTDRDGRRARRSSVWRWERGGWRAVFHQGTLLD